MQQPIPKEKQLKIISAGAIGNILEWYDFGLYGYFAPILAHLFFPSSDQLTSLLSTFSVFAVGFFARPIGAAIFGHFGDLFGRKKTLLFSILLMAIPTTLMGLLPTYNQIGIYAILLLITLRILQGISVGGEYTCSMSYLVEHAPPNRRGLWGSFAPFSSISGILLGSAIGALITTILPTEEVNAWGWRIPFILGIIVGIVGIYLRKSLNEPKAFESLCNNNNLSKFPLKEAFKYHWKKILTVFLAVSGNSIGFYMLFVYMTTYISNETQIPLSKSLEMNTLSMIVLISITPFMGLISDKIGRKPLLILCAILIMVFAYPLFHIILVSDENIDITIQIIFAIIYAIQAGVIPVWIVEFFPTRIRLTAISIAFNLSQAVFGGTTPLICTYLIKQTGIKSIPAFYLIISFIIPLIIFILMKETYKDELN